VKTHLRSDFPVALALSGGVDSTVIAAYACHQSSDFRSYSSAHPVADAEKDLIETTRDALSLNHEFVPIEDVENAETIDFLLRNLDQPFISSTTLYQFNIRKAIAKRGYRVLMTGDGADEIFSSYTKSLPKYFSDLIRNGRMIYALQQAWALRTFAGLSFPKMLKHMSMSVLRSFSAPLHKDGALKGYIQERCFHSPLPYWLRVEDGIAMSLSLETRLPFLDHEIAEYVYSLPPADFFRHGVNKFFLRDAAKDVLPIHISNEKMKFQRPGNNDRLIFGSIKNEMLAILLPQDMETFRKDAEKNKNSKLWFRIYLALRWRALIEERKAQFYVSLPQKVKKAV
jgi:asparagine synthase (glutamine-hydrolysing)